MKFSEDQRIWIIEQYAANRSPTVVMREFMRKYGVTGRKTKSYSAKDFQRVFIHFQQNGTVKRAPGSGRKQIPSAKLLVQSEIQDNPVSSVRQVSRKVGVSKTTVHRKLKFDLKLKPYKFNRCQQLTENHREQRLEFCRWIEERNIDVQKVIFTDEKFFVLHPNPNKQNTRIWSLKNPYLYEDSIKQGGKKVMAWAGIADGKILPLFWFDEGQSVNSDAYFHVLEEHLWPAVRDEANSEQFYYQQDGATPHCSNKCMQFLQEKFPSRVISRRSDQPWPAHSPDLSPLDYWFWGEMQSIVYSKDPQTIEELKQVVNEAASRITEEKIRKAVNNFYRRLQKCKENGGGHFEAEL